MIRRDFLKRMAFAALASGMLGSELLRRSPQWWPLPGEIHWQRITRDSDGSQRFYLSPDGKEWIEVERISPQGEKVLGYRFSVMNPTEVAPVDGCILMSTMDWNIRS